MSLKKEKRQEIQKRATTLVDALVKNNDTDALRLLGFAQDQSDKQIRQVSKQKVVKKEQG